MSIPWPPVELFIFFIPAGVSTGSVGDLGVDVPLGAGVGAEEPGAGTFLGVEL